MASMVEASQGPFSVRDSEICGNETGVLANNAANVEITGSVLAGNALGQVFIAGANGPREVVDSDTGATLAVRAEHWVLQGNEVAVDNGHLALGTYLSDDLWSAFIDTLQADRNRYSSRSGTAIFGVPGGSIDLNEWKAETGVDHNSTYSSGPANCRVSTVATGGSTAAPGPNISPASSPSPERDGVLGGKGGLLIVGSVVLVCLLAALVVRGRRRRVNAR